MKTTQQREKKGTAQTSILEKEINEEIDKLKYDFFAYEDITDIRNIDKLFDVFKKWAFNFIKQREKNCPTPIIKK